MSVSYMCACCLRMPEECIGTTRIVVVEGYELPYGWQEMNPYPARVASALNNWASSSALVQGHLTSQPWCCLLTWEPCSPLTVHCGIRDQDLLAPSLFSGGEQMRNRGSLVFSWLMLFGSTKKSIVSGCICYTPGSEIGWFKDLGLLNSRFRVQI